MARSILIKRIDSAIETEMKSLLKDAYVAGYREAAALYGRNAQAVSQAYAEAHNKSDQYVWSLEEQ